MLIIHRYMFDEPSSYLDVKQRLRAANAIRSVHLVPVGLTWDMVLTLPRSLVRDDDYIICVEHDLSVLDYLSDFICVLYGKAAVYGVVTLPASVREGINIFLDGNIPTENLRFREESLQFRIADTSEDYMIDKQRAYKSVCSVRKFPSDTKLQQISQNGEDSWRLPSQH